MTAQAALLSRVDHDHHRSIVLNRPDRANALSAGLVEAIHDELDAAESDQVRTVVIAGAGRSFCAGLDLTDLAASTDADLCYRLVRIGLLLDRLAEAPFTTIARVTGAAVGAGADLAVACDHRLGSPAANFRFPGSAFGIVLGTARLSALVGEAHALRLVGGQVQINAADALGLKVLTDLGEPDQLDTRIAELANEVGNVSATTLRALLKSTRLSRGPGQIDQSLAELVRSLAGRPGLKDRIQTYANARRRPPS